MFGFQYKHHHFYHDDGEQWIMWDEIYTLLKGGEHGARIIYLWEW
jgi:ligand-binding SRPBCC domain-containing protein